MGWMHDMLKYFSTDPLFRKDHQTILHSRFYMHSPNAFYCPFTRWSCAWKIFASSQNAGDDWQKFQISVCCTDWCMDSRKKLLFMGGEFAQRDEWNHEKSLDWHLAQFPPHAGCKMDYGFKSSLSKESACIKLILLFRFWMIDFMIKQAVLSRYP